ncbi:unnamed protein product [Schistosoma mattheei]|uniref:Uncharacterized protein n=1 Tax=Schistosoma mattheei TaxID=31246 RepID=A0A183PM37_9TREM|nr:unnamed protein product [Schistosoma mattheei]
MDAEHSDDWGIGGELELAQDFEVIDLNEFDSSCGYISEADDSTYISSFLNGLVTDETLYSRYLNGIISFDDLMREMNHSTTLDNDSCHSSDSDCSSKNDDSEYSTRKFTYDLFKFYHKYTLIVLYVRTMGIYY